MNNGIIIFSFVFLVIAVSCNKEDNGSSLERKDKTVIYEVDLSLDPELPNWMGNIDSGKFIEMLLEKVKSGKLTAYSPLTVKPSPLTWNDIEFTLGVRTDSIEMTDPETGKVSWKVERNEINTNEIKRLIFIEEWSFDESNLQFNKKILGLAPVRVFYKEGYDTELKSIAFVVYFGEKKPPVLGV